MRSELRREGGVARARTLEDRGHSRTSLARLVSTGRLIRPQRGWLALPDAEPALLHAARRNATLTCVTVAEWHGLWLGAKPYHLHLAPRSPHAHMASEGDRLHWGTPIRRREPHALLDSLENALHYVASCLPFEEALAVWESAMNRRLMSPGVMARLPLRGRAARLLSVASELSDSGLETYVRHRLEALGLRVVAQAMICGHRVDFLIEGWLVFQVDGEKHHRGRQRERDNRHDALLALHGYGTVRAGYREVREAWPQAENGLLLALAQGPPR